MFYFELLLVFSYHRKHNCKHFNAHYFIFFNTVALYLSKSTVCYQLLVIYIIVCKTASIEILKSGNIY